MKALLLAALAAAASAAPSLPARPGSGRILDEPGVLSPAGRERVRALSEDLERRTGAQLAVAVVFSLQGLDPADYANRLFRAWGVGRRGFDDGVLLLVCPDERKSRIETGYGVEHKLTDAQSGRILKDELRPYFQAGRFEDGIVLGARRIEEILSGQPPFGEAPSPPPPSVPGPGRQVDLRVAYVLWLALLAVVGGLTLGAGMYLKPVLRMLACFLGALPGVYALIDGYGRLGEAGFGCIVALWAVSLGAAMWFVERRLKLALTGSEGGFWSTSGSVFAGGSDFGGGSSGGGGAGDSW